jgi:hypothetical protein
MSPRAEELLEAVKKLPHDERADFVGKLHAWLDEEDDGLEADDVEWTPELERRAREALRGENLVDADEVFAEVRAKLISRR